MRGTVRGEAMPLPEVQNAGFALLRTRLFCIRPRWSGGGGCPRLLEDRFEVPNG
ncbi:MAG: hypothetical protein ACI9W4_001902 [Rhodothermales bacterium]|jgi:hypothetical protein